MDQPVFSRVARGMPGRAAVQCGPIPRGEISRDFTFNFERVNKESLLLVDIPNDCGPSGASGRGEPVRSESDCIYCSEFPIVRLANGACSDVGEMDQESGGKMRASDRPAKTPLP